MSNVEFRNSSFDIRHLSIFHGEGGIRTPDKDFSPYNGLANRRLQPLGHLSHNSLRDYGSSMEPRLEPHSQFDLKLSVLDSSDNKGRGGAHGHGVPETHVRDRARKGRGIPRCRRIVVPNSVGGTKPDQRANSLPSAVSSRSPGAERPRTTRTQPRFQSYATFMSADGVTRTASRWSGYCASAACRKTI